MLKKTLAIVFALVTVLSLCSCSLFGTTEEEPSTTELITEFTEPTTEEETTMEESTFVEEVVDYNSYNQNTAYTNAPVTQKNNNSSSTGSKNCVHTFNNAGCKTNQVCTKCGYVNPKLNKHSYAPATCTSPEVCRNCGTAKPGSVALGHDSNGPGGTCARCAAKNNAATTDPNRTERHYTTSPKTTTAATTTTAAPSTLFPTIPSTVPTTASTTKDNDIPFVDAQTPGKITTTKIAEDIPDIIPDQNDQGDSLGTN